MTETINQASPTPDPNPNSDFSPISDSNPAKPSRSWLGTTILGAFCVFILLSGMMLILASIWVYASFEEKPLRENIRVRNVVENDEELPPQPPRLVETDQFPLLPTDRKRADVRDSHNSPTEQLRRDIIRMAMDNPQREKAVAKLRDALAKEFQRMHDQRAREIDASAKRLEDLRSLHEQRSERKDEIIDRRLAQLTGQPDVLDWAPQGTRDRQNATSASRATGGSVVCTGTGCSRSADST